MHFLGTETFYSGHAFSPLQISSIKRNVSLSCCQGSRSSPAVLRLQLTLWKLLKYAAFSSGNFSSLRGPLLEAFLKTNQHRLKIWNEIKESYYVAFYVRNLSIQLIYWEYIFLNAFKNNRVDKTKQINCS